MDIMPPEAVETFAPVSNMTPFPRISKDTPRSLMFLNVTVRLSRMEVSSLTEDVVEVVIFNVHGFSASALSNVIEVADGDDETEKR
jgi:hypothetical protein